MSLRPACVVLSFSTGESVSLPAASYTPVAAHAAGGDSDSEADDQDAPGGDDDTEQQAQAKKKVKGQSGKGQRNHDGPKAIRVLAFHPSGDWFMYQSEEKYLHLYHMHDAYESGFKHIVTLGVSKKVQCAVFHGASTAVSPSTITHPSTGAPLHLPHILMGDKTGDIFLVRGEDLKEQSCELGHLANITSLAFHAQPAPLAGGKPRSYLLSSDSDGKIRISNVPNYFDIQAFCLGHQAFVSTFDVVPAAQPVIVSGGLGAQIILWQLEDGKEISRMDLASQSMLAAAAPASSSSSASDSGKECYISQISYVSALDSDVHTLLVTVYPWSTAFLVAYTASTRQLSVASTIALGSPSMHAHLSGDQLMYIDEQLRVCATNTTGGAVQPASEKCCASFNVAFASAQESAKGVLITEQNAQTFIGSGVHALKNPPTTEEGKARAAAATTATGRYISPFSSLQSDHLLKLSLLSNSGFTFRRYIDKVQREDFIQGKKKEAQAKREAHKQQKQTNKIENARKKKAETEATEEAAAETMEE